MLADDHFRWSENGLERAMTATPAKAGWHGGECARLQPLSRGVAVIAPSIYGGAVLQPVSEIEPGLAAGGRLRRAETLTRVRTLGSVVDAAQDLVIATGASDVYIYQPANGDPKQWSRTLPWQADNEPDAGYFSGIIAVEGDNIATTAGTAASGDSGDLLFGNQAVTVEGWLTAWQSILTLLLSNGCVLEQDSGCFHTRKGWQVNELVYWRSQEVCGLQRARTAQRVLVFRSLQCHYHWRAFVD